ncbi:HNH endonuclease [Dysgonomonas reticulitermitis]
MIKIQINETLVSDYFDKIKTTDRRKPTSMHTIFVDNIEEIVKCKPEDFAKLIKKYKENFKKSDNNFPVFHKYMENQYKTMSSSCGHWLAEQLNVKVCPYCNRHYTFTIEKKRIQGKDKKTTRPEFDHFYPKSEYPYLALSFYNLIPSCPTCNHIKDKELISINPYLDEFGDNCKFVLKDKDTDKPMILDKKNITVGFSSKNDNITVFGLKELYNEHIDYVEEIIDKAQAYNAGYYNFLIHSFSGLGATPEQIDRYVWGNYTEMADQCKRPLSKLTRDVLEQLDIK